MWRIQTEEATETGVRYSRTRGRMGQVDLTRCTFLSSTLVGALLQAQSVTAVNGGRSALTVPAKPNAASEPPSS